jgi:hypothetical protein
MGPTRFQVTGVWASTGPPLYIMYIAEDMYTKFRLGQKWTCTGPSGTQLFLEGEECLVMHSA